MSVSSEILSSGNTVTTGTTTQMLALTGSVGQTFFNTTYSMWFAWVVDRWWPLGDPDPRYGFLLAHEEFTGNDRIGTLDWSGNSGQVAGNLLNPGIATVSQTTAAALNRMSSQLNTIQLGTMDFWLETIVSIPTLSNGTDNAAFVVGFSDQSAYDAHGACTDGAFFMLDYTVDQTHWTTNTTSNGTNTQKVSVLAGAVPVAGTYYRLSIFVQGSTSVTFYVNGVAITAAHATNIPSGAGRQTGWLYNVNKSLGSSTAMAIQADSFDGWAAFNGQRVG